MKYLAILLLLLLPTMTFAQTQADYEEVMGKFMKFYNNRQPDSIVSLFRPDIQSAVAIMWGMDDIDMLLNSYGKMKSFKYLGKANEDGVTIFKGVFSKRTFAIGITLPEGNKIGTFQFDTSSEEISEMLRASK